MKIDKNYVEFIQSIKRQIVQSRYAAARLANKEQLFLYFTTGKTISDKIKAQKWGAKVLDQISADLQKELPGLKGFSSGNLKKIRLFTEAYSPYIVIGSTASNQIRQAGAGESFSISSTLSNLIENKDFYATFAGISFSHHFTIITKIKSWEARIFYIQSAAANFWSLTVLEHHIENDLYGKEGKLPNNFANTMAESLKPSALKVFKDEYLLDFIAGNELDDERHIEQQVLLNIRNFILQMGKGFCFIGNQYRLEVDGDEFFIISRNLQNAFASFICSTLLQLGSNNFGLPTRINVDFALDAATFKRFRLYKNSIPLGASSGVDVDIENMTTGASCPWNLSTVPT